MFTPLELAAVGLTEEKAAAVYGESSVQVCREFYIVSACPGIGIHNIQQSGKIYLHMHIAQPT